MRHRDASIEEVRTAIAARFTDLDDSTLEAMATLAFMYGPPTRDDLHYGRAALREAQAALEARNAAKAPTEPPDEAHVRLGQQRDELRDGLVHVREMVFECNEPRFMNGIEYPPTTVVSAEHQIILKSRRGSWWRRFLFHGVCTLREQGCTLTRSIEVMNELAAMVGHFPDARRLRIMHEDPSRTLIDSDLLTRDLDLLRNQVKKERRARRRAGQPPVLSTKNVLREKPRLRRKTIRLFDLEH